MRFVLPVLFSVFGFFSVAEASIPHVSANGLFLYRNSNFAKEDTNTERNGLDLQEAEISMDADVDAYSRFSLTLALHSEYELDPATNEVHQHWHLEPEEIFAELTQIPGALVKIGKFRAAFGKSNLLHTHALPFVDAPIVNTGLLGEKGLNDIGVSVTSLLPTPWISEGTLQYLRGAGENAEFNSPTPGDGVGLMHWKNLGDFTDTLSFEVGLSYAQGGNSIGTSTRLVGGNITLKGTPSSTGAKENSWRVSYELIDRQIPQPGAEDEKGQGANLWGQYQVTEKWAALLRYEELKLDGQTGARKTSASVVFSASESSFYRLEYDWVHGPANAEGATKEQKLYLQASFAMDGEHNHAH